ncbi:LacI family DNA-binding transcriptional regulator [Ornithinicoccus halotolerans]|uniref:LacI family DNA-binding transcriptional regulator n=1 Tax=Ornithinicoccus halotolerans TaxID=1748220 RepID=UPI0012958A8C|nr:LacI family DNA-binding transcriptional regulator [Ornithinicoccus halotolerans]
MSGRLDEVARRAGVSEATVSRVLNGKPGVSAAARASVLTAVDVLGYDRPSRLRRAGAGLVGLVVPELSTPIFPAFAQAVEAHLAAAGYACVLCPQLPGGVREDEYVQLLLDRGVAAIIFVSGHHADTRATVERYHRLRDRRLPIALVNGYREDVPAPFVSHDGVAAAGLAVRHLRDLGHTLIGLATGPRRYLPVQRRIAGFRAAVADLVEPDQVEALVQTTLFSVEGGATAGHRLVESGATAVVCGSDLMAFGVVRAARQAGLRVPEDVSVVGADDSPLLAFTDPPLTTVRQDVASMSEAAVNAVLEEIDGAQPQHQEFLFAPELVVRGSTAPAPDTR